MIGKFNLKRYDTSANVWRDSVFNGKVDIVARIRDFDPTDRRFQTQVNGLPGVCVVEKNFTAPDIKNPFEVVRKHAVLSEYRLSSSQLASIQSDAPDGSIMVRDRTLFVKYNGEFHQVDAANPFAFDNLFNDVYIWGWTPIILTGRDSREQREPYVKMHDETSLHVKAVRYALLMSSRKNEYNVYELMKDDFLNVKSFVRNGLANFEPNVLKFDYDYNSRNVRLSLTPSKVALSAMSYEIGNYDIAVDLIISRDGVSQKDADFDENVNVPAVSYNIQPRRLYFVTETGVPYEVSQLDQKMNGLRVNGFPDWKAAIDMSLHNIPSEVDFFGTELLKGQFTLYYPYLTVNGIKKDLSSGTVKKSILDVDIDQLEKNKLYFKDGMFIRHASDITPGKGGRNTVNGTPDVSGAVPCIEVINLKARKYNNDIS